MEELKKAGGSAGNYAMMGFLHWTEDDYWRIRNKAIERGFVGRGKGRGGSVYLISAQLDTEAAPSSSQAIDEGTLREKNKAKEASLYQPCLSILQRHWAREQDLNSFHAEITANPGGISTGGAWTRPDISALSLRVFPNWPGRYFDLWTFEIKTKDYFDVIGIFEAAAHARRATHAWALYQVEEGQLEGREDHVERLTSEAQRLGVGLIFFKSLEKFEEWDIRVESVRQSTDPQLLEEYISTQLSQAARDHLLRWSKT